MTTVFMYLEDASYRDRYDHLPRERWNVWYSRAEREHIFQSGQGCYRRDGGQWKHTNSSMVLRKELFFWLMENIGIPEIVWECDRLYYADEVLPELPECGGRRAWEERFKSYYDFSTGQVDWRWIHATSWIDYSKGDGYFVFKTKGDAVLFWLHASGGA